MVQSAIDVRVQPVSVDLDLWRLFHFGGKFKLNCGQSAKYLFSFYFAKLVINDLNLLGRHAL